MGSNRARPLNLGQIWAFCEDHLPCKTGASPSMRCPATVIVFIMERATDPSIPETDLRAAHAVLAQLVITHGDAFLPLFECLDLELDKIERRQRIRERALAIVGA